MSIFPILTSPVAPPSVGLMRSRSQGHEYSKTYYWFQAAKNSTIYQHLPNPHIHR